MRTKTLAKQLSVAFAAYVALVAIVLASAAVFFREQTKAKFDMSIDTFISIFSISLIGPVAIGIFIFLASTAVLEKRRRTN